MALPASAAITASRASINHPGDPSAPPMTGAPSAVMMRGRAVVKSGEPHRSSAEPAPVTSGMLAGGCSRTRFNGQLAPGSHTTTVDFHQVRDWLGDRNHLPSGASSIRNLLPLASGPGPARSALGGADARRQLERDLHDGVQNEIVALIIKLTRAEQDPDTPSPARSPSHARSILDSVRQVACGIYRPMLADSRRRGGAARTSGASVGPHEPRGGRSSKHSTGRDSAVLLVLGGDPERRKSRRPRRPRKSRTDTTNTAYSPCASRTKAVALTPRTPPAVWA